MFLKAMTFLFETFGLGLANLRLHKLRSLLTALGIIFGVFAVIMMIAIGEGNNTGCPGEDSPTGRSQYHRTIDQAARIREHAIVKVAYAHVRHQTPRSSTRRELGARPGTHRGLEGGRSTGHTWALTAPPAAVYGTTDALLDVTSLRVERGRYLTTEDTDTRATVAVIGAEVATRLFPLEDPVGSELKIGSAAFKVIGVLRPVGLAGGAGSALVGRDLNFDVHIPITTAEGAMG